ncbi:MAG TPA: hypothetical protein VEG35_07205 [Burkholderiales bacterium]|nr:hypothetical protein [Burkholderiales bacterium]
MGQARNPAKDPAEVIQEIEAQLDQLLKRKIEDIEHDLAARLNREKEAARRRQDEVEREFATEREALSEYRASVRASENERAKLLEEARGHFGKIVQLQSEIEGLAKATVEEIRKATELQERIEGLRERTAEHAAFLKTDLRERFGIVAEVLDGSEKPLGLDLDRELEKLRKIKELLAIESAAAGLGGNRGAAILEPFAPLDLPGAPAAPRIPEIQELVTEAPAAERAATPAEPEPAAPASGAAAEEPDEAVAAALESWRRTEPANGNGEIHYFQRDNKVLVDGESLFSAVDRTINEAERLSAKLGRTESPKEQFFIKQELINWQEGLRALFLRIIKMIEKRVWELPEYTADVLSVPPLRGLLERLSMENWSNPEEFASFRKAAAELEKAYFARVTPRGPYLRALKKELESC